MTTAEAFRHLALSLPRAVEKPVLGSQEFRVRDRAFATLGWPEAGWAVVRLTPDDQAKFMAKSQALAPEPGGRGRRGVTRVRLAGLDQALLAPLVRPRGGWPTRPISPPTRPKPEGSRASHKA